MPVLTGICTVNTGMYIAFDKSLNICRCLYYTFNDLYYTFNDCKEKSILRFYHVVGTVVSVSQILFLVKHNTMS